jgi:phosphoserine phosphatase
LQKARDTCLDRVIKKKRDFDMNEKRKIISLSAIGLDSPGLVSRITTKIFQMNGNIIDVEESCRRGLFSMFVIVDFSASSMSLAEIMGCLNLIEGETGLRVVLASYDEDAITRSPDKENHLVTILGVDQPGIIARVSTFFHRRNINIENCRMIARGKFFSMEMIVDTSKMIVDSSLSRTRAIEKMKEELRGLCAEMNQSLVIQSEDIYRRTKKLVVFDVESSLLQSDSLKEFLERVEGEFDFIESAIEYECEGKDKVEVLVGNARRLKGIPAASFEKFNRILQLNPGSLELIRILKSMGFKIALLSSGFHFFVKEILEAAGVDYAFCNTFKVDEQGLITGELEEPIITNDTKNEILEFMMKFENISRDEVIAVGDGSIHSHFMKNVGLSITFKPYERHIKADGILSSDQMMNMLYCLGMPKTELEKFLKSDARF